MKKKYLNRQFQRQLLFILLAFFSFALLFFRLFDVQLVRGGEFLAAAEENRFFSQAVLPMRGVMLDRYGEKLVSNQRVYWQLAAPEQLFGSTRQEISHEAAVPLIATDEASVFLDFSRQYPWGAALAHTVGYVGFADAAALAADTSLLPEQLLGKAGLESSQDQRLRGVPGHQVLEVDALAHKRRLLRLEAAEAGETIQTSIDPYLSQVAYAALGENKGAVIISDVETGQILALVSKPSFDPGVLARRSNDNAEKQSRQQQIATWFADPNLPFFNRAIAGSYPPGSVFKLVTALVALEKGAVTPETTVLDEGVLKVGDYEYGNWYFSQYGRTEGEISLVRAIARSNDIYFYKAAEWVGPDALAEFARLLGFGQKTGIALSGEAAGIVPDPAWKEKTVGDRWFLGNTYHFGIGQGDVLVTPLQINQLIQTIGNKGRQCKPSILIQGSQYCYELGLQEADINLLLEGMVEACSPGGTSFPLFAYNAQFANIPTLADKLRAGAVACKTGTAEFGAADANGHRKTHGWWVGILDVQPVLDQLQTPAVPESSVAGEVNTTNPYAQWKALVQQQGFPRKIALTVLVESDETEPFKEGSTHAAPVGKAIIDWLHGGSAPAIKPAQTETTTQEGE